MHHDLQRLWAVREHDESFVAGLVAVWQGIILLLTVFVSLVLARGARISTNDVLRWRVAKAELGAVACTAINVMLVLLLGSWTGKALASGDAAWWGMLLFGIQAAIIAVIIAQLGCLYKTCLDVVRDKHAHISTRAPRVSAVMPQPLPRRSNESDEGPGSETSPATPASIDPPADWRSVFARMSKEQDEKYERAMKERDEKYEHAMKERDEKYERAMLDQDRKREHALKDQKQDYEQKLAELREMLEVNAKAPSCSGHLRGKNAVIIWIHPLYLRHAFLVVHSSPVYPAGNA